MRFEVVLIAAALVVGQEQEERSVEEELGALIVKTNELESFHLIYDLKSETSGSSKQGTLEFVHRAPDVGHVRIRIEDFGSETCVDETFYYFRADLEGRIGEWRAAQFPEPPPAALMMNELFPPTEKLLGPGVYFDLKLRHDSKRGDAHVSPTMGRKLSRTCLFGWLEEMRIRASEVSVEEHCLVLEDALCRYFVSRESGLLERAELSTDQGGLEIRMREYHLDEPLAGELAEVPEEALLAKPDPELTRSLQGLFAPRFLRLAAFDRIENLLASGLRPLNELTQNDWRTFLDALHRDMITERNPKWIEQLREYVARKVAWVNAQRAEDDSPERHAELERAVAEDREKLGENFENAREKYTDELPPVEPKHGEPRQELFDIELEVIADLWEELLCDPILETFDEKFEKALR